MSVQDITLQSQALLNVKDSNKVSFADLEHFLDLNIFWLIYLYIGAG